MQRLVLGRHGVELVEDQDLRHIVGTNLAQHALHFLDLLGVARVGGIDHVQQQIGVARFLQRGGKGIHQGVRQVADEAHGVGQRDAAPDLAQVHLARGGVERGKELVGGVAARLDQRVEERGLARVGVTHQRHGKRIAPLTLTALRGALALDFFQPLLGALDGVTDHAAVELDLGFAGATAHANTTALALQVRPAPHQAGGEVLQPRQFHLQLAFVAAGALGENFKNQQDAVVDRHAHVALQVALLGRAQGLVEQDLDRAVTVGQGLDLVGLAGTDEQRRVGRTALARDAVKHAVACGGGQLCQLVELGIKMGQSQIHTHQHHTG